MLLCRERDLDTPGVWDASVLVPHRLLLTGQADVLDIALLGAWYPPLYAYGPVC